MSACDLLRTCSWEKLLRDCGGKREKRMKLSNGVMPGERPGLRVPGELWSISCTSEFVPLGGKEGGMSNASSTVRPVIKQQRP